MVCTINIPETNAFKELASRFGSNKTAITQRVLAIQNPTPDIGKPFDEWYKENYGEEPNLDSEDSVVMADRIEEFYYQGAPSVKETSIGRLCTDEASLKGYKNTDARNEAITRACEFVFINQSIDKIDEHIEYTGDGRDYVRDKIRETISDELVSRICKLRGIENPTDEDFNNVYDEFEEALENGVNHLRGFLNNEFKNGTTQDANLIAMCSEIMDDESVEEFIDEMIRSNGQIAKIISSVREHKDNSEEKTENKEASEEDNEDNSQTQDNSSDEPNETGRDVTIGNANTHLGALPDFKLHISDNIRTFLSAIYKLNTPVSKSVNGTYDYNTDNELGLPSLMDVNQLMNILYTCVDYTNGKTMLESIKMVAEQVPEMQGLIQVYDRLNEDKDLRCDFYRTFGKAIVSKLETVLNGETITTRVSNRRADRLTSLYFEYYNSTKRTSINLSNEISNELKEELETIYAEAKTLNNNKQYLTPEQKVQLDNHIDLLVNKITDAIKRHCPSVDVNTISNYITNNDKQNENHVFDNARTLLNIIGSLNTAAAATKLDYDSKVNILIQNRIDNNKLKEAGYVNANQLKDETSPFKTEYAEPMQAPTQELAKALLNFTVIKTELNSRNVHGNLSSDVINCSMLTNIMKTLQNEVALKNFGDAKSLSNQYNLSNIMLEQTDEEGNIISRGLFRNVNGKFIPTSYAPELIKVKLFNGAGDENNGHNILYSEMSKGDYIATALVNFFDENDNTNGKLSVSNNDCVLASYFMKIPSDAPKNFCITAPRYNTGTTGDNGLFRFENPNAQQEIDDFIESTLNKGHQVARLNGTHWLNEVKKLIETTKTNAVPGLESIADITVMQLNGLISQYTESGYGKRDANTKNALNARLIEKKIINKSSTPIKTVDELVNDIINLEGKPTDFVTIKKGQFEFTPKNENGTDTKEICIVNKCITEDGEETYYFIRGIKETNKTTGISRLVNAKFDGFLKYSDEFKYANAINSEIKSALNTRVAEEWIKKGKLKRVVNINHPVFKQVRNAFIQELTDAATALSVIFETNPTDAAKQPGCVNFHKDEKGNRVPTFKEGYSNNSKDCRKLYENYHVNGSGLVLKEENGKYVLTGNVFKSDRFIYVDRTTGKARNFGQEILDEAFNLLYGGAQDNYIHTAMVNGRFVAVPTDVQMAVINAKLSEFLQNYVQDSIQRIDGIVGKYNNLDSVYSSVDRVTEFSVNYLVTYIGFNDLFEGDSKFYKGSQDILKRAKEVQGSGVPYGTFDITRPLYTKDATDSTNHLGGLLEDSILNEETIDDKGDKIRTATFVRRDKNGNVIDTFTIDHHAKFTGVTIKNSISTGKTIGEFVEVAKNTYKFKDRNSMGVLSDTLYKVFLRQGYTPDEAFAKTEEMMSAYANTKVNDAQSYITFEEWIKRIAARGQYKKYKSLIDKILDESQELTPQDLTEFIQVQKNFYYDQHYNNELGIYAPRQIKNAEFVLVPRFIKGTELERVYNIMKEHNIDQLNTKETSKAGKCKVLNLWNDNCELDEDLVKDFEDNVESAGFKEYYNYNYLYTQSETPQHMDDTNKAAIQIMKKIVDNVPYEVDEHGNPTGLYKKKLEFFDLYSENIHDNFEELMDALGISLDKNGNIKLSPNGEISGNNLNPDGSVQDINYDLFFEKLDDEFRRQGLDSNLRAYVEQIAKGSKETKMPLDMGAFSAKVESIAQSLFNSYITRQTLPGYHAAQITNVGWHKLSDSVENYSYSKELRYHPKGEPYVEIMLPKSMFSFSKEMLEMPDDKLLEYLESEGLDMSIGYRIPTEGKQSVCVFKVVGFTDAALGSTIVVPNDWVSQTGSDFDIDSVYGITPEYYHDKDGLIHIVKYNEIPDLYDWFRYINRNADKPENFKIKKELATISGEVQDELNADFDTLQEKEATAYHNCEEDLQEEIKKALAKIKDKKDSSNKQENYLEMLKKEIQVISKWLDANDTEDNPLDNDVYRNAADLQQACEDIIFAIENAKDNYDTKKREKINAIIDARKAKFDSLAKKYNLMSYEEFMRNPIKGNTRKQRNNRILSIMIDILSHPSSLEENLSQSSFRYISEAKKECYAGTVEESIRDNRSTYNFLDNADYQEDAMSGAKLKAFSVTRDTIVSVCNTAQPIIADSHSIKIGYKYNPETYARIRKAYAINDSDATVTKENDTVYVIHDRLGWSLNNHNVVDKILTAYDSQTTAYILDVIKEGNIPNVNDETFGVYKTLTDVGSTHLVSVAFMMQPGIAEIVKNYNANKSIYQNGNNNPVHAAIKTIAARLGVTVNGELVNSKTRINQVIDALNNNKEILLEFNRLFNPGRPYAKFDLEDTTQLSKMTIDSTRLIDRIKQTINETTPVEEIFEANLHDLFIVLQYNKIKKLSDRITLHGRVLNPDKFGAKQTIYATRKIFKDIDRIISLESKDPTLICFDDNGNPQSLLEAIYPGITNGMEDYMSKDFGKSVYPPLNAFLKYSTCTSIKVNKNLFLTQSNEFIDKIESIQESFTHSDTNPTLSEKIYNDYKNYVLGEIYANIPVVLQPIAVHIENEDVKGYSKRRYTYGINGNGKTDDERSRIFGYGRSIRTDLHVEDLNNITEDELNTFLSYTPAQKIAWIKQNYRDAGIFKYIDINVTNIRNAQSQKLEFSEDQVSPEVAYTLFKETFYNNDPFVKLAAYDLIKYGFVVEGFKMMHNGIAKKIVNDILINDTTAGNTAIDYVKRTLSQINDTELIDFDRIARNFIRSNHRTNAISTKLIEKKHKDYFSNRYDGMIELSTTTVDADSVNLIEEYNIGYNDGNGNIIPNRYVKLKEKATGDYTLYEIKTEGNTIFLIPLNKLQSFERSNFSVNENNNIFKDREYYIGLIDTFVTEVINNSDTKLKDIYNKYAIENKDNYNYVKPPVETDKTAKPFNLEEADNDNFVLISRNFEPTNKSQEKQFYFISGKLNDYISTTGVCDPKTGEIFCSIQTINGKQYKIVRVDTKPYNAYIYGNKKLQSDNNSLNNVIASAHDFKGLAKSVYYAEEYVTTEAKPANTETVRESKLSEEMITSGIKGIIARRQSSEAAKALSRLDTKDIKVSKNNNTVSAHLSDSIEINAEYVSNAVEKILNDCKYFCQDDDGVYHSIDDDYSINLIKNDVKSRERYIKICNDARALVKSYSLIKELDIDAEDENDKKNLRIIRENIIKLDNSAVIRKAEERFVNDFLSKLSSNPLVKSDIITLLDGYHSASFFDCYIGDLQNTSNPLIQIVTKEAMADIRGKEMKVKADRDRFIKAVNTIRQRAKQAGVTIDMSHIIDDSGRFIQAYSQALIDDMNALRDKLAETKEKYGVGSNEYQLARLEYKQWKLDYIHQIAPDDYYKGEIKLIKDCLIDPNDPFKGFEPVYLKYCELNSKRFEILSHMSTDGALDEHYKQQLKDVNRELDNLRSNSILDENGNFFDRYEPNDINNPYTNDFDKQCYRPAAQHIINDFISKNKTLKEHYFEKDAKFGFEEELEKNLTILNSYPKDEYGNYVTPMNLLMEDEKFAKAKEWLDNNATRIVSEQVHKAVKKAYETLKGKVSKSSKLKQLAKEREAYDANGVIDATKLTNEDIKTIFDEQFDKYKYDYTNPFSDTMLMTAVNRPVTIYKQSFYQGLLRDVSKNREWVRCINEINDILKKVYSSATNTIATSELSYEDLKKLNGLYNELADLRKYSSTEGGKRVFEFMSANVEAVYDEDTYNREREKAKANFGENSLEYNAWLNANSELQRDDAGNLVLDSEGHVVLKPNHFLYGFIQPKGMFNLEEFTDDTTKSSIESITAGLDSTSLKYKVLRNIKYTNSTLIGLVDLSGNTPEEKAQNFDKSYKKVISEIQRQYPNIDIDSAKKIVYDTFAYHYANNLSNSAITSGFDAETFFRGDIEQNIVDTENTGYLEGVFNSNTNEFVDTDKTNALRTIMRYTETVYTPYYYQKLEEMRNKSKAEYDAWYKANHIYNPYKHRMEALPCWYQTKLKDDVNSIKLQKDEYVPKWSQTETKVREDVRAKDKNGNYYYKEGYGNAFNYKHQPTDDDLEDVPVEARTPGVDYHKFTRKDNKYDNTTPINTYEQELKELMYNTLLENAKTDRAKKHIERGFTAMRSKQPVRNRAYWINQGLQLVGWSNNHTGNEVFYEDSSIDYSRDRDITMPMLTRLGQRDYIRIPEGSTEEEKEQINKENEEIKKENERIQNEVIDKNWIGAIEEFIIQAGHYNAVQDNKQILFFAKNMLDRMEFFDKKIGQSNLQSKSDSTEDNPSYIKKKDEYLKQQYVNWLRRLLYEQYKEPNDWLTRTANILQSLNSAKYMMLNITGGISNVTLGVSQIFGEAFAKEYFGASQWHKANSIYRTGITDSIMNMYNDKSTTKAGAIIKHFNIVDFDEIRGIVPDTVDFGNYLDRLRDLTFSPQTMGEHYMQNTAMFAMMESHRIIANNDPNIKRENIAGLPQHKIMNEAEYVAQALENKVKEIIGAERYNEFVEFKKSITKDPNVTKDYAWFKKDPIHQFVKHKLNEEEQKKYIESKKEIIKQCKEEFAKAPKLIDQFELDSTTGHLAYAKDSLMSQLPEDVSAKLCGEFKGRVISVNKKIHGVYDKLGAAKIESSWWGSLVMQYHKHLYPGIMKRYRRKGYFNEERGTIEKGFFWSLADFLNTPLNDTIDEYKNMPENERDALKGVQMFMQHSINFITNFELNWNILPEYEKANIKRNLGDLLGWGSAILAAIVLRVGGDDDDKDKFKNVMYNLALYEADRLASESFMYNPLGLVAEFKTLWSSPIACQSGIIDLATCLGEIAQWLIQGDDYNAVYKTGLYAGESKIKVKLTRQLPIYRTLDRLWNLDRNNRYYKIGTTGTMIVPIKDIADAIKGVNK